MNNNHITYRLVFDGGEDLDFAVASEAEALAEYEELRKTGEDYGDPVYAARLDEAALSLSLMLEDWVGKNYGTQEMKNPCYDLTQLAQTMSKGGLTVRVDHGTINNLEDDKRLIHIHVGSEYDRFRFVKKSEYANLRKCDVGLWKKYLGEEYPYCERYIENGECYAEEVCIDE